MRAADAHSLLDTETRNAPTPLQTAAQSPSIYSGSSPSRRWRQRPGAWRPPRIASTGVGQGVTRIRRQGLKGAGGRPTIPLIQQHNLCVNSHPYSPILSLSPLLVLPPPRPLSLTPTRTSFVTGGRTPKSAKAMGLFLTGTLRTAARESITYSATSGATTTCAPRSPWSNMSPTCSCRAPGSRE